MNEMDWLVGLGRLITPAFYLVAVGYVLQKPADGSPARFRALVALTILLLLGIGNSVIPLIIVRTNGTPSVGAALAAYSFFATALSFAAHALLISAIFTGRLARDPLSDLSAPSLAAGQQTGYDNPYQPPDPGKLQHNS